MPSSTCFLPWLQISQYTSFVRLVDDMDVLVVPKLACNPEIRPLQPSLLKTVLNAFADEILVAVRRSAVNMSVAGLNGP